MSTDPSGADAAINAQSTDGPRPSQDTAPDPMAGLRRRSSTLAALFAVVFSLLPIGLFVAQLLAGHSASDYRLADTLYRLFLPAPAFIAVIVLAVLQFRTRERRRSTRLFWWTLGLWALGVALAAVAARL